MSMRKFLSAIAIGCALSFGLSGIAVAKEPVKRSSSVKKAKITKASQKKRVTQKKPRIATKGRKVSSTQTLKGRQKRVKAVLGAGVIAGAGAAYTRQRGGNSLIYSLMDLNSGEYLESSNTNKVHSLASLTKLMSSYVFVKHQPDMIDCEIVVTMADKDNLKNTRTRVERNTAHSCIKILEAVLVMSDNWAASALSKSLPGVSQREFISLMNKQAKSWGMHNTSFFDAAGLSPSNRSTANDLNILISQVSKNPMMQEISSLKDVTFYGDNGIKTYSNTNMLVREDFFGSKLSKTGYINESGYNLVFVPEQCEGNKNLALVIMGAQSSMKRASFARNLLNKYNCS